ncbi:putative nuclease HARBI1 [Gigaspora margarita]|uniref:Putative nuclease HARBI1 n=1 Tax=Gigaspora margarita TaxID=4874 RepID=A0A8H3X3V5_GIGMA|nr:putative nuclease HARBI1 [Gigaspora margarita]
MLEQILDVSQGSVSHFTDRFLKALLDLEKDRIVWPQGSCLLTVTRGFENSDAEFGKLKLPNVIGAMDGNHIPIHAPSENGSVHDARVFYRSSLHHEISLNAELWVPGGTYIIADAAYPL